MVIKFHNVIIKTTWEKSGRKGKMIDKFKDKPYNMQKEKYN
jgi:hypothetical protein